MNDGNLIPRIGLGLYQSAASTSTTELILNGIDLGYSLFDTAELYRNETEVGKALKENSNREKCFVTTKILRTNDGRRGLKKSLRKSLRKLDTDFVDLYLIHAPQGANVLQVFDEMTEMKKLGLIRSIGVSNFGVQHLKWLENNGFLPVVNQIELHPWWQNEPIVEFCREKNIQIMAYSPLAKGKFLGDSILRKLGETYRKTPAQILIRWSIQNGFIPIPKTSSSVERLRENIDVFDFSINDEDMKILTEHGRQNQQKTGWDPTQNGTEQFGPISLDCINKD